MVSLGVFICNDKKIKKIYLIVNGFALIIGYLRSMVYANGIVESIFMNCALSMLYWITIVEGYYLISHCTYKQASKLLQFSIILISITCATSLLGSIAFPGAIRESSDFSEEEFKYYWFNMGSYSYIYAVTFFVPIFLFYIKNRNILLFNKGQNDLIIKVIFFEIIITILLSQFMTALLVSFVGVFCLLCSSRSYNTYKHRLFKFALLGIILLFSLAPIINWLSSYLEEQGLTSLAERFNGIHQVLTEGFSAATDDVGARIFLYSLSLQHLVDNPLFGLWGKLGFSRAPYFTADELLNTTYATQCVGQHSDIIDLLGGNGLFGLTLFFGFLYYFWKNVRQYAKTESAIIFMHIALVMFIVYGIFDASLACLDVGFTLFVLTSVILLAEQHQTFKKRLNN